MPYSNKEKQREAMRKNSKFYRARKKFEAEAEKEKKQVLELLEVQLRTDYLNIIVQQMVPENQREDARALIDSSEKTLKLQLEKMKQLLEYRIRALAEDLYRRGEQLTWEAGQLRKVVSLPAKQKEETPCQKTEIR